MKRTKLLVAIIVLLVCAALSVMNATVGLAAILTHQNQPEGAIPHHRHPAEVTGHPTRL